MRDYPSGRRTSPLTWLMCALAGVFLVQMVAAKWFPLDHLDALMERSMAVTIPALRHGHVWVLLTAGFLHSTVNILHIVGILFALYFLGRELMPMLGTRRFFGLYAAALILGGLSWAAVNWRHDAGELYGSMPAIDALIVVWACFFPNREIPFLLFFFIPVRLKPKYLAAGLFLFDLFGFLFYEIMGAVSPFGFFAHSAHLGGMAAGWLYYRFVHDADWNFFSQRADVELPQWLKHRPAQKAVAAPAYRVNVSTREDIRAEVDRILDKINSDGFGALTPEEKRRLDEARDLLSRR
ncbi:MAG TPA: rhomboid family intramembrane serine protease [Opitutaceae bacterium]|nr:rhomboid family intramembrane serine protease [Opitutaceae bacterium]